MGFHEFPWVTMGFHGSDDCSPNAIPQTILEFDRFWALFSAPLMLQPGSGHACSSLLLGWVIAKQPPPLTPTPPRLCGPSWSSIGAIPYFENSFHLWYLYEQCRRLLQRSSEMLIEAQMVCDDQTRHVDVLCFTDRAALEGS